MTKLTDRFDEVVLKITEFMKKEPHELCFILLDMLETQILRYGTRWI